MRNTELKKQNEEAEQLDEYTPDKSGVTRIQGRSYGASKPEPVKPSQQYERDLNYIKKTTGITDPKQLEETALKMNPKYAKELKEYNAKMEEIITLITLLINIY